MTKEKIYIEKIEIIDFESHKHTVLEDLSKGFNCLSGKNDVGKSSIIRALMLCAYNQFDPQSIRTGAEYCNVTVTTNIGSVNVKRGKGMNKWTVQRKGCPERVFDKVGRNEVSEACAVLGMKMIKLGDVSIPVNLMNQFERHFLLSGVGDEKVSGSVRAQIIDEICGLHGAEELIQDISLDQYRISRQITVLEEKLKDINGRFNSQSEIDHDERLLKELEQLESNIEVCRNNVFYLEDLITSRQNLFENLTDIKAKTNSIPDIDAVEPMIKETKKILLTLKVCQDLAKERASVSEKLEKVSEQIQNMPIVEVGSEWRQWIEKAFKLKGMMQERETCANKLLVIQDSLRQEVPDVSNEINEARMALNVVKTSSSFLEEREKLVLEIRDVKENLKRKSEEIEEVEKEIKDLYADITVCPITKKPIGEKCSILEMKG